MSRPSWYLRPDFSCFCQTSPSCLLEVGRTKFQESVKSLEKRQSTLKWKEIYSSSDAHCSSLKMGRYFCNYSVLRKYGTTIFDGRFTEITVQTKRIGSISKDYPPNRGGGDNCAPGERRCFRSNWDRL